MTFSVYYDDLIIEQIAKQLYHKSYRNGRSWVTRCPAHDDQNPSLSLSLGHDGKLLAHCFSQCSFENIMRELELRGLCPDRSFQPSYQSRPMKTSSKSPDDLKKEEDKQKEVSQKVLKIWNESKPAEGTLVEAYLRYRGLTITPPETLRFHPGLAYWEQDEKGKAKLLGYFPAMIGCVQKWAGDEIVGLHRTYLTPDGQGKANVPAPKKMLGIVSGGFVQFGDLKTHLILAEGIESALSVYVSTGIPSWAVLSTSNFKSLILPPSEGLEKITLAVDNDLNGAGQRAAREFYNQWKGKGYQIKIASPPSGLDMNDLLRIKPSNNHFILTSNTPHHRARKL